MPQFVGGHVNMSIAEYSVRMRPIAAGRLSSHLGTTLRGALRAALRDISCTTPREPCCHCTLRERCAYGFLFETLAQNTEVSDPSRLRVPHPFALRTDLDHPLEVQVGQTLDIGLLLVGRAIEYLPQVLLGLGRMGQMGLGARRVPFSVDAVAAQPSGEVIYDAGFRGVVRPPEPRVSRAVVGKPRLARFRIRYRAPLRLKVNGKLVRAPVFVHIANASLQRLEFMCRAHAAGEFSLDAAGLAAHASSVRLVADDTEWRSVRHYSRRQSQSVPMGGLVGSAEFEGDIGTFGDLLSLAGRVHIGKSTSFGHGYFTVEEDVNRAPKL